MYIFIYIHVYIYIHIYIYMYVSLITHSWKNGAAGCIMYVAHRLDVAEK